MVVPVCGVSPSATLRRAGPFHSRHGQSPGKVGHRRAGDKGAAKTSGSLESQRNRCWRKTGCCLKLGGKVGSLASQSPMSSGWRGRRCSPMVAGIVQFQKQRQSQVRAVRPPAVLVSMPWRIDGPARQPATGASNWGNAPGRRRRRMSWSCDSKLCAGHALCRALCRLANALHYQRTHKPAITTQGAIVATMPSGDPPESAGIFWRATLGVWRAAGL